LPPPERLKPMTPPPNFARVDDNIYRSGFPGPDNLKFLSLLGLEEIFILCPDEPSDEYDAWIFKQGNIIVRQLEVAQNRASVCTTTDQVGRIVRAVQRAVGMGKKVLVHCNGGKHRTGCVIGALRLGMGWEIEEVVDEYRAFAGEKRRDGDEHFL
ncbi:protein-tyrosine phosphatase, partial [Elsinoe ampelina]